MKKILISLVILMMTCSIGVKASDLIIESKNQTYNESDNRIKFDGDVKVSVDELQVVGTSADVSMDNDQNLDTATFYDKPYAYEVKKNKKREVKANILKVSLITKIIRAEGDTQSTVFDGKTPIVVINADVQEYDTNTGIMTADGNVTINYNDLKTFSNHAKIKTDKNGDLKNIELIGNAKIREKTNESEADRFFYNASTKIMNAYGNTTTTTTNDDGSKLILKSNMQEYNQSKGLFNASGNVRIWYKDYYAAGPKIAVYPNPKTGKPDEIFFTGRSSITQGVRTIFADKIKMTIEPKSFNATGNTRTVIKNIGSGDGDSGMGLGL
jgi:lipopolysaccharide export system protein LptA